MCVNSILNKVLAIIQEGVHLVLVLDGNTPPLKKETTERRKQVRVSARSVFEGHQRPFLPAANSTTTLHC